MSLSKFITQAIDWIIYFEQQIKLSKNLLISNNSIDVSMTDKLNKLLGDTKLYVRNTLSAYDLIKWDEVKIDKPNMKQFQSNVSVLKEEVRNIRKNNTANNNLLKVIRELKNFTKNIAKAYSKTNKVTFDEL